MIKRWDRVDLWLPFAAAALPIMVGAVRLYVLAYGDFNIFQRLLGGLNLTAIFVSGLTTILLVLVPLLPAGLVATRMFRNPGAHFTMTGGAARVRDARRTTVRVLAATTVLAGLLLPFLPAIALLALVAAAMAVAARELAAQRAHRATSTTTDDEAEREFLAELGGEWRTSRRLGKAGIVVVIALMAVAGPVGVPVERVTTADRDLVGRVVQVDDTGLTLLLDGGIEHVRDVTGRYTCQNDTFGRPGLERLFDVLAVRHHVPVGC